MSRVPAQVIERIRVERLRWWHLGAVLELDRELFGAETWSLAAFWNELAQVDTRHYLVAFDEDKLVGMGGIAIYEDEAHVLTLGVQPTYQRHGVGSRLLSELLTEAESRSSRRVLLEVRESNVAAQKFYARHGFRAIGRRNAYYQPSGEHAVVMARNG